MSSSPLVRSARVCRVTIALVAITLLGCMPQPSPAADSGVVTEVDDDPDFQPVTTWLVAGPFPSPDRVWTTSEWPARKGFDTDFLESIGGEVNARPSRGQTMVDEDGNDVVFLRRNWRQPYIDLTDVFGRIGHVTAYLYAELESDRERNVYLHIGSNDAAKLWVNGELVLAQPDDRRAEPSQNVVRVHLAAGKTPVLMKIDQAGRDWGVYFEIAEQSHRPPRPWTSWRRSGSGDEGYYDYGR